MKKDFKDRLGSCVKDLTGAEIKGITIDEEGGQVAVVLVPGRGHGRVSLSQLPDVLQVADVDIVGGDLTLLGPYAGVRDFVESWNLEADDPRIGRFIEILRRETRGEVTNVEFRAAFGVARNNDSDENRETTMNVYFGAAPSGSTKVADGALDEYRAEKVGRSADWIRACWQNQATRTFCTVGPVCGRGLAVIIR